MSSEPATMSADRTSPNALGVLPQWVMAFALSICVVMIFGLFALVFAQGISSFWPSRVESVTLASGEEVLGLPVRTKVDQDGSRQTLYRVGNRDLGGAPFRWVQESDVASRSEPADAVLLERQEWGIFIGRIGSDAGADVPPDVESLADAVSAGRERRREMEQLRAGPLANANRELREISQAVESAGLRLAQAGEGGMPRPVWLAALALGVASASGGAWLTARRSRAFIVIAAAGIVLLLGAWLERPEAGQGELERWYSERVATLEARRLDTEARFVELNAKLERLQALDREFRVAVASSTGVLAPESQSAPDQLLKASQIVRVLQPNALGFTDKASVFVSRWKDYLLTDPREANTEGGIFPVIIGTVTVTLLLTIVVVPLGVLAALYIREYAKQGALISVLRVAINNLAGVPSIVYGIFGLGFFCYAVGGYIDGGPEEALTLGRATWWIVLLGTASAIVSALLFRSSVRIAGVLWALGATAVLVLFATSPYFDGFFRVKLLDGEPTFGSSGLLWASLT
ncbi:MAG: hypothetical protein AAGH71_06525, partial [Planctomycetota bacterium]